VSFNFLRQAVQKGCFSISELSIFVFFNALASFQLTLTGNNKSYFTSRYDSLYYTGSCLIRATMVALACA